MSALVERLSRESLALTTEECVRLAEELLDSVQEVDAEVDAAWDEEIKRRIADFDQPAGTSARGAAQAAPARPLTFPVRARAATAGATWKGTSSAPRHNAAGGDPARPTRSAPEHRRSRARGRRSATTRTAATHTATASTTGAASPAEGGSTERQPPGGHRGRRGGGSVGGWCVADSRAGVRWSLIQSSA